jgi:hypothetical protein
VKAQFTAARAKEIGAASWRPMQVGAGLAPIVVSAK